MTIYALSTAPGRAGIAVIRLSGSQARPALAALCQGNVPAPRLAALRTLRDPNTREVLDRGLVLWFPGPHSFTGEDMAELHLHGGRSVIEATLDALAGLGLRMAAPGEFTRRAFENGKLDLTEAEGLADLINADTALQRRQALAQAVGALRMQYEAWRSSLLRAMAYVEASLDFADEGDIAEGAFNEAIPEVQNLIARLEHTLAHGRQGEIVREGIQVAIIGAPNAGKSSLLNALAGRDAAIVFDEPGTTRDVIEVQADLEGYPFVLRDTAGLRETESAVEQEGIRRARATAANADIVLWVRDTTDPTSAAWSGEPEDWSESQTGKTILVWNKIDLASGASLPEDAAWGTPAIQISAKTGECLDQLKSALVAFARDHFGATETPLITRARHRQEIQSAHAALNRFLNSAITDEQTELAAEHLREAADALGRLTGRLDVEDVLGQIFAEFCIGK
jgi:tRNA modification GTPase